MKSFLASILFIASLPFAAQVSSYEELEFEPDSITSAYKPVGKNYVLVKSKRGTSGVNRTAGADAILNAEVSEIVLVFSELESSAIADREEANRERWENLLKTYPELFQYSTTYKNLCQCNTRGDSAAFKKAQGFYIYVNGDVPKVDEPAVAAAPEPVKAATPKAEEKKPAETKKVEESKPVVTKTEPLKTEKAVVKEAVADKTEVKKEEPVKQAAKEVERQPEPVVQEEAAAPETPKVTPKKKAAGVAKPRKSSDPKACRPTCYGYGDEDLIAFFKEQIPLTKKQRRKAKNWVAAVKLQIHFDGSIKKVIVTGTNEAFNTQVQDALKNMNNWNSAVKNGLAVKSEVRFNLKFDKPSKSMKPMDIMINPRLGPKCRCMTDSELFGSD